MGIFKNFKHNSAVDRLNEERIYEIVINEIKSGKRREGIWGQALEKANGDLKKTEANYIKLRVQSLKDEFEIQKQENADRQIIEEEFQNLAKEKELKRIEDKERLKIHKKTSPRIGLFLNIILYGFIILPFSLGGLIGFFMLIFKYH